MGPLHLAAKRGEREYVKELLQHKTSLHAQDKNGWTPLHNAVYWNRNDCIKELLNPGTDLQGKTNDGQTAADLAQRDDD